MGRCRVLTPDVTRLPLSDGDFIDVKTQLNAGEYVDLLRSLAARDGFSKLVQYIVGWSLPGLDEKPLPYSLDQPESVRLATLRSLDNHTWSELVTAIDTHEKAQEAAREAKKKTTAGALESSAISVSVK